VTNLVSDTEYTFSVRAKDTAGNLSFASDPLTVRTLAPASGVPMFVKGINFNGEAVMIEGNQWLGESQAGVTLSTVNRYTSSVVISSVDSDTSAMLNSAIWSSNDISTSQTIANGQYEIYLWLLENYQTNSRSFHVELEGAQVTTQAVGSMPVNEWRKLGPFPVTVADGVLNMDLIKLTGDPGMMGMAIYSVPDW
jgi:hypothetical protein